MRLFFGVPVDDEVRNRVRHAQDAMRAIGGKVTWVEPANFHLTLRFIGEVPEGEVERIGRAAEGLERWLPTGLVLRGVGVFPNAQRPRVIWVGLAEGGEVLAHLSRELNERLQTEVGLPAERRPFAPHLTIGRIRAPVPADSLTRLVESLQDQNYGSFWATQFALYQSTLTPRGAIYRVVRAYGAPSGGRDADH